MYHTEHDQPDIPALFFVFRETLRYHNVTRDKRQLVCV